MVKYGQQLVTNIVITRRYGFTAKVHAQQIQFQLRKKHKPSWVSKQRSSDPLHVAGCGKW